MNKPKISVIVPVYNVDRYLEICIDSLINQTYDNLEIILINDGSTDDSKLICEKYLNLDKRIKLINQKNKGVSSARNNGIRNSSGEYIVFVDSDDYCELNMFETIVKNINLNKDTFIIYGYNKIFKNKKNSVLLNENKNLNKNNIIKNILIKEEIGGYLWNKLFIASIIKNNNIKFNNKISYCEDLLFVSEYIRYIKRVKYLKKSLYNYRMRKNSVTYEFFNNKNISILDSCQLLIEANYYNYNIRNNLEFRYLNNYYKLRKYIPKDYNINLDILKREKEILKYQNLTIINLFRYYLIKYFNNIYMFLRKIKNISLNLFE